MPNGGDTVPLIVNPHGGPHGISIASFVFQCMLNAIVKMHRCPLMGMHSNERGGINSRSSKQNGHTHWLEGEEDGGSLL